MYNYHFLTFPGGIVFLFDSILVCVDLYYEAFLPAFNGVTSCREEDDDEDEDVTDDLC